MVESSKATEVNSAEKRHSGKGKIMCNLYIGADTWLSRKLTTLKGLISLDKGSLKQGGEVNKCLKRINKKRSYRISSYKALRLLDEVRDGLLRKKRRIESFRRMKKVSKHGWGGCIR